MADQAIEPPNDGIIGVSPIYSAAYLDTFRETMSMIDKSLLTQKEYGLTGKEYSNVYSGALQYAMATSAQLAKDEAEVRYRVENTLDLDRRIKIEQIAQLKAETYFKMVQAEQVIQSVYDNRLIKIADSLSNMVGLILNGGTQSVPEGLMTILIPVIHIVKSIPKMFYPSVILSDPIDMYTVTTDGSGNTIYTLNVSVNVHGTTKDVPDGDIVSIIVNGITYTAVTIGGVWSTSIPGTELVSDPDRMVQASVSVSDELGNVKVSIDTVAYTLH